MTTTTLRVGTWNLWGRFGDWRRRMEAIAAVLAETNADVWGLQEVWQDDRANQAEDLARALDLHATWTPVPGPARWHHHDPSTRIGNAILSRWHIDDVASIPLCEPRGTPERRNVLRAVVRTPHGPLAVFTTQLTSSPSASAVRVAQVAQLVRFVAECDEPVIVTGDFNAIPDADEIRLVEGLVTAPVTPDVLLVDSWRYADPAASGFTWDRRNPHVAATGEPSGRIDYIFIDLHTIRQWGSISDVELAGDHAEGHVWPSDHGAVVATMHR
jgi:endonuclease/exonuclease/phosphatase family metal-dependent hydrolase